MLLSNPEKLILLMLSEIYDKLKVKGEFDTKFIRKAIFSENTWALSEQLPGVVGSASEVAPPHVQEVREILGMWVAIERAFAACDEDERKMVTKGAGLAKSSFKFIGFDGNNEGEHKNAASFLVDRMEQYQEFEGRSLNSHSPALDGYRRMLAVYESIRSAHDFDELSASHLVDIMKARRAR
jgi:uncharacterized protein YfbU (UPF0304 family)